MTKQDMAVELRNVERLSKDVASIVETAGVKGLSKEKAEEYGLFLRIGKLLALLTTINGAANRVYGAIDTLITDFGVKRHEIKRVCVRYEEAYEKFLDYWWKNDYLNGEGKRDLGNDVDDLFQNIMRWSRLPVAWELGDEQEVTVDTDAVIRVDDGDSYIDFFRTIIDEEDVEEAVGGWCVTKYDNGTKEQHTVYTDMAKADAMVVAKRLSDEDRENFYTASLMQTSVVRKTEIIPARVCRAGEIVGDVRKRIKNKRK